MRIAREVCGEGFPIAIDANQRWDVGTAIRWIEALSPYSPHWVEEPTSPDDVLGHATIARAIAPIPVATGEHVQNRVIFKQLLQTRALSYLQIDAARVAGVNENIAILLLAAKFGVPVCPHAGGVGLCELVQHLSMFDYVSVTGTMDNRVIEYVDHLARALRRPRRHRQRRLPRAGHARVQRRDAARVDRGPRLPRWAGLERVMTEFAGLRALVTGGGQGIGLAIATLLTERGARVACLDLNPPGEPFVGVKADVTDDASVRAAVTTAAEELGGLDIVVNNAGIGAAGTVADNDDAEWLRVYDVNVVGMVRVTRAALPYLRESDHAAIVNTCSIAATAGHAPAGALQRDEGRRLLAHPGDGGRPRTGRDPGQLRQPGHRRHPWVGRLLDAATDPAAERAALNARQPMGRLVTAEEVAHAVAYLASPLASATTGTSLAVDGGMQGLRLRPRS